MAQTKFIAIGCIALVVLIGAIVVCVVGGIFVLGLSSIPEKVENEGVEFGKATDQRGCQDESLRRLRAAIRNHDLVKRRAVQLFAYGCFQTSRASADFCANAPHEDAFFANRKWSQSQCEKEGLGDDDGCRGVFMQVSEACLGKTPRRGN